MGEVYLVEHLEHGRREALKILRSTLATEQEFVHRFRREARAINRVQHPNIVGLYDFGCLPDGRFYLTMEYAEGELLSSLLERRPKLTVVQSVELTEQIADAVGHAHSRGVVHRDLKPQNMILTLHKNRTVLKILDFGIAKIIDSGYSENAQVTGKGVIFGTPAYMAPEQVTGIGDDPRSDIYSIGCLFFEMLVGEPPFTGGKLDVIRAHTTEPPDRPSMRRKGIPPELDAVVLRALAKDPDKRYQHPAEMVLALERVALPGRLDTIHTTQRMHRIHGQTPATGHQAIPGGKKGLEWKLRSGSYPAVADTSQPTGVQIENTCRALVRQLAESLLDSGVIAPPLLIGVTNILQMESRIAALADETVELEGRSARLDQAARERQASLRFALGELRYECTRLASVGERNPDLEHQIRELEIRLESVSEELARDQARLTERGVEVAAERSHIEDRLAVAYEALHPLVDGHVAEVERDSELAPLVDRLQIARSMRESS
jgi:serine/threonine protein kinase